MEIERLPFAAGDYLTRYPAGHHYSLRIDSPFEKPGWKSRTFSPTGQSMFPGTAIEFEGRYYEIIFQDYQPGPPLAVRYYLNRWEDRFPIRVQFHYNEQECRNLAEAYQQRRNANRTNLFLLVFAPLIGLLPAEDQTRLGNGYGIPPTRLTFLSALMVLPAAGFGMIFLAAHIYGSAPLPGPTWIHWLYPTGFYFFAESLLRMMTAVKLGEPVGSILSAPIHVWRARPGGRTKFQRKSPALQRDEVIEVSGTDYDLEIISDLPKNHWTTRVGIHFKDAWYGVVGTEKLSHGKQIRYLFRLKRAPEGTWFGTVCEYDPSEVNVLHQKEKLIELKTWVDTFALFWGFLPREDQIRLENLYDFDSLKFNKITIVLTGIVAFVNCFISAVNLFTRIGSATDAWILVISGFFLFEVFLRWKDLRKGEPSGSVLAVFIRPLARKLLEQSPTSTN
jgi:hypothetical protein